MCQAELTARSPLGLVKFMILTPVAPEALEITFLLN